MNLFTVRGAFPPFLLRSGAAEERRTLSHKKEASLSPLQAPALDLGIYLFGYIQHYSIPFYVCQYLFRYFLIKFDYVQKYSL